MIAVGKMSYEQWDFKFLVNGIVNHFAMSFVIFY